MWKLPVFCIHHLPPSLEVVCCLIKMWITAPKTNHLTLCEVLVRFLLLSSALSICCFGCYGNEWSRMCAESVLHVQSPWSALRSDAAFQFRHDYPINTYPIDFFLAWYVSTNFFKNLLVSHLAVHSILHFFCLGCSVNRLMYRPGWAAAEAGRSRRVLRQKG